MLKKIAGVALSVGVAVAMVIDGYIVFFKNQQPKSVSAGQKTESTANKASNKEILKTNSTTKSTGKYKDGTYTGSSTSTHWGDVQLQITIAGGKVTSIKVLSSPDSEQKSIEINEQALPTYKAEAIKAQSASIQQISGATETFKGFTGSLQNALNQAEQ